MARINIEDCWWTDPRRERLGELVGSMMMADAIIIRAWRLAQEFWGKDRALIPKEVFGTLQEASKLIQAHLAEERDNGIYVRGSSQYLDWHFQQRESARKGGKKSAERPRDAQGRLLKKSKQPSKRHPSESKVVQVSVSGSVSGSSSDSKSFPPEGAKTPTKGNPVVAAYYASWQHRYPGERPVVLPQHQKFLKSLGEQEGIDRAVKYVKAFLSMPDPWFMQKRHDVETMKQNLNAISHYLATGKVVTKKVLTELEDQVDKNQGTNRKSRRGLDELLDQREAQLKIVGDA